MGDQYIERPTGAVVIPMIAFIEGRMRIPMDRVMKDFLIFFRTCPTQCSLNLFKVVNSVAQINKKIGVNLTHHDINWVYSCQDIKGTGYYLRTRVPAIMLTSYHPKSNKGLDEDYLILSGDWHDGLCCPVRDGEPSGVTGGLRLRFFFFFFTCVFPLNIHIYVFFFFFMTFFFFLVSSFLCLFQKWTLL